MSEPTIIHPEALGAWELSEVSDLLHERDALRANVRCMVLWLEANQPDVFRRGLWDALAAKEKP